MKFIVYYKKMTLRIAQSAKIGFSVSLPTFSLSQIHNTKEVYKAKNIVNTSLLSGSPLVDTFKFVAIYIYI